MDPLQEGVYDSFRVLRNCIASSSGIASNLLLCDEMLKARQMVSEFTYFTCRLLLTCSTSGATARFCRGELMKHRRSSSWVVPAVLASSFPAYSSRQSSACESKATGLSHNPCKDTRRNSFTRAPGNVYYSALINKSNIYPPLSDQLQRSRIGQTNLGSILVFVIICSLSLSMCIPRLTMCISSLIYIFCLRLYEPRLTPPSNVVLLPSSYMLFLLSSSYIPFLSAFLTVLLIQTNTML